ncbi:MBL fold metallo-hydrolase [uncultured Albimonas sp.]|uniref:MBL fold metallo-hydrolase n=1 Tax=uncultured Albimonas sp. TaxID=1331701 RepID=UPI0030EB38AF
MDVKRAVEPLGEGLFAWVQGDGSWGWSNAGLVVSEGETLLIDTLFTAGLTRDMLEGFRRAAPQAARIDTLLNTHANGDHTFGNHLVEGARIVASAAAAREMAERTPEQAAASFADWRNQGEMGAFLHEVMGSKFDFSDVRYAPPTETFSGRRDLQVGALRVELHELGPAHTAGDVVAWIPERRVAFTGDLVFNGGAPILWAGPVGNWIRACELMLSWEAEIIVPGHGPVGDRAMLREMLAYLTYVRDETAARHRAGLSWQEAAWDISMDGFCHLGDRERIVCNVAQIYRELSGGAIAPDRAEIVALMGRWHWGWESPTQKTCPCGHPH